MIGDHTRAVSSAAAEYGGVVADRVRRVHRLREAGAPGGAAACDGARGRRDQPGKGKYEIDTATGAKTWVDRFDTGLVDLGRLGGLFQQVNGRTSQVVIDWLGEQDPAWRAGITHVSMDTSATYAKAAREALPHAKIDVDRFHLVALVNRPVTEWAQRNRLLRAADTLSVDESAKLVTSMARSDPTGGLEKCWRAKEMLRGLLGLAGPGADRSLVWQHLTRFYDYAADSDVAQLRTLAWTVNACRPRSSRGCSPG